MVTPDLKTEESAISVLHRSADSDTQRVNLSLIRTFALRHIIASSATRQACRPYTYTSRFRACLVFAYVSPANVWASQNIGVAFHRPHLANSWAQNCTRKLMAAWACQILGFNPNDSQQLGQRQLFGLAAWGSYPNRPTIR
jgi:hypothetical protein